MTDWEEKMKMSRLGLRLCVGVASLTALTFGALAAQTITAAGATFPAIIYGKWFEQFRQKDPSVQINYQAIGSGGGIKQLTAGTVDFGASDKPMSDEEIAEVVKQRKFKPLHFPTVLGAVVPIYNIEGVTKELKFTGDALAGIFLGTVTKWNDKAIASANPGVKLPDQAITVVVRSDSSGTSFVFTDFLTKVNDAWKNKVGANAAPNWPVGLRAKGSEGVSGQVKQLPNSIGYVELTYAIQNNMGYGSVQNSATKFIKAELASVTAAAAGAAASMPEDFRVSITNAPGAAAYPISTFTWLLIPDKISDPTKKKAITEFLSWMLTTGQQSAAPLHYAPLPKQVIAKEQKAISLIK
ncbi:MAG: phosphate transporter substrate-binding protein PhoT family [Bryobacterales bacterium]|nr:phosphate transporter substrate-binding protein PhoT family [Bryobacterales bacterium]